MEREPVPKLPSRSPDQFRPCPAACVLDPGAHAGILTLEHTAVTVGQIHRPRNDDRRIGPSRGSREVCRVAAQRIRDHPRDAAARTLIAGDIAEPLREETGDVHVERGGAGEDLRVARPSQTLVALRAVGGHVEEVAALTPHDVVLQLIQQRVGRDELTRLIQVGRHRNPGDRPRVRSLRKALHRHVAEAMEREVRLEDFLSPTLQNVSVRLFRIPQIRRV